MAICPKCNADNRPEAAFCTNCGTILLAQPAPAKPIQVGPVLPIPAPPGSVPTESPPIEPVLAESSPSETASPQPAMQAEIVSGFPARSEGSVFNDRFRYETTVYQDEHEIHYTVTEINQPSDPSVRMCSNPQCRTIHVPTGAEPEKFCTRCGQALEEGSLLLFLQEADMDRFGEHQQFSDLQLVHPHIHPPIASFQQALSGGIRYCLVTPLSGEMPEKPEISQVLEWGMQLADGLDYLQDNGVAFGEELDPSSFGLVDDLIVWRNFNHARVLPMLADREKINNVRLLALSLYYWITGKSAYGKDSSLSPALLRLFHQALVGEGFTSGAGFAEQIDLAIKAGLSPFNLDYHFGRRTHPGQVRDLNEDSLLCLALSTIQQGFSQPAGLFAIADGMGGHATGDLASSLAIQSVTQKAFAELTPIQNMTPEKHASWLQEAVQTANQVVFESRQKAGNDMGSTLVCVLMLGNHAYLAHVGDSRIYLLRDGAIQQLTTDHSLVQHLVSIGDITPDEARVHPQRNVIYRSLGEKLQVDVDHYTLEVQPGDRLLLCSDGLSGMLDDQKIRIIVQEAQSPQVACDFLVDAANLAGGEDNISAILVEVILA